MKKTYRPEIKICGITNLDDARAACEAGADYLGFVLFNKSPRAVSPATLRRIREKLDTKTKCVGVFVNQSPSAVAQIASDCGLDVVQLCAEEQPKAFRPLPLKIWRVIRIRNGLAWPSPSKWPAERYVLDSSRAGLYGGTGVVADWAPAARISKIHKIMLAGGLKPANVADAIRIVRPFGVDVSSGIECRRGKKDHDKMRFFIEAIRNVCKDINSENIS